jgi:hypothetical protein
MCVSPYRKGDVKTVNQVRAEFDSEFLNAIARCPEEAHRITRELLESCAMNIEEELKRDA